MSSSTTAGTDPSAILARAVEQAVLAPSSHNTQPWLFRIDGESLELYADRARGLRVNDPDDRELTVSCGAALLNARVAAEHAGAALEVELLPDGDGGDLLARARLAGGSSADARLFAAIADRRTYRRPFSDRAVPADALARLEEAAAAEGAWLDVLDGRRRAELVSLVAEGDRTQFADPRWRRELASWMRSRRAGDGLALPRLAAPLTRFAVTHLDMGGRMAARDAELAQEAPVLALLATEADGAADWLRSGQALERLLLTAAAEGLLASYLNQPLQLAGLRPRASGLLSRAGFAQVALRLGYPTEEPPSAPRRPVAAVVEGIRPEVGEG